MIDILAFPDDVSKLITKLVYADRIIDKEKECVRLVNNVAHVWSDNPQIMMSIIKKMLLYSINNQNKTFDEFIEYYDVYIRTFPLRHHILKKNEIKQIIELSYVKKMEIYELEDKPKITLGEFKIIFLNHIEKISRERLEILYKFMKSKKNIKAMCNQLNQNNRNTVANEYIKFIGFSMGLQSF